MNAVPQSLTNQTDNASPAYISSILRIFIASIFGVIFMQLLMPVVKPTLLLYGLLFMMYVGVSSIINKLRPKH